MRPKNDEREMTADATNPEGGGQVLAEGDAPARIAGFVVDAVLVALASFVVLTVLGLIHGPVVVIGGSGDLPDRVEVDTARFAIDSFAITMLAGFYFAGSWVRSGATPGQGSVRLRVLDATGRSNVTVMQAVIRFLALGAPLWLIAGIVSGNARLAAWCLTVLWYGVLTVTVVRGSSASGIHDRLARTVVVRDVALARTPGSRFDVDATD